MSYGRCATRASTPCTSSSARPARAQGTRTARPQRDVFRARPRAGPHGLGGHRFGGTRRRERLADARPRRARARPARSERPLPDRDPAAARAPGPAARQETRTSTPDPGGASSSRRCNLRDALVTVVVCLRNTWLRDRHGNPFGSPGRQWSTAIVLIGCAQLVTLFLAVGPYPHDRGQRLCLALLACAPSCCCDAGRCRCSRPRPMPTWAIITVIVGWIVGWSVIGAWRMVTRDA